MTSCDPQPIDLVTAARAVEAFQQGDLTLTLSRLESAFAGQDPPSVRALQQRHRVTFPLLASSLLLKRTAGQVNVLIHAVGILLSLPYILEQDEKVEYLSLGAGNTGRPFDLETTARIAEFKFIQWRGGPETIRQNSLFKDFFYLAEANTAKQKYLYLMELDRPVAFLRGGRSLESVMSRNARLKADFSKLYGDRFSRVRQYYEARKNSIKLIDLTTLVPEFREAELPDE